MTVGCVALLARPASGGEAGVGPPALPDAGAAILVSAEGHVLWELRADARMFPASLTKIMTAALAVEAGGLERMVTVSQTAAETPETGLSLERGERLKLGDLLRGALIWSANDASTAVAEAVGGSVEAFVERMNRRAAEWGATHTHFANPHGLHSPNHYSTARDLATIAVHAMRLPEVRRIVATQSMTLLRPVRVKAQPSGAKAGPVVPQHAGRTYERRVFTNRNRLLLR